MLWNGAWPSIHYSQWFLGNQDWVQSLERSLSYLNLCVRNRNYILGSLNYSFCKANAAFYSPLPYCLGYEFITFETLKYRVKQCHLQWSRVLITFLLYLWAASLAYNLSNNFYWKPWKLLELCFASAIQSMLFNRHGSKTNWLFRRKQSAPQKLLRILSSGISLSCWPYLQISRKIQHHNIDV